MRKGWRELSLEELVLSEPGGLITDGDWIESKDQDPLGEVRLTQLADIGDGLFLDKSRRFLTRERADELRCTYLSPGDLLIARMPDPIGRCAIFPGLGQPAVTAVDVCIVRTGDHVDTEWLMNVLNSRPVRARLRSLASGGTRQRVATSELRRLRLRTPDVVEQRRVATVLRTWDEAIAKLTALRAAKKERLAGLAAKLIHRPCTERLYLRRFLREVSVRNRDRRAPSDRVLSVTNSAGFVLAHDQFAHRVASTNLSNYKVVCRGQYAYNPARINVGSIARLDDWGEGVLSPMYVVFEIDGGLDSDFFRHWLDSGEARQRIRLAAQGSVRETVSFGDFGSILVPVPSVTLQRSIAGALNAARSEVQLIDEEIKGVDQQRRGLMQKLLTGAWQAGDRQMLLSEARAGH